MQPRERRETGEQDQFRSPLDQIIDMEHPHVLPPEPVEKVPFRFAIPAHLLRVITAREGQRLGRDESDSDCGSAPG
jgi:hypothetical protein